MNECSPSCVRPNIYKYTSSGGFSGGPVVKHPLSNAGDAGSVPGQELRSHVPGSN